MRNDGAIEIAEVPNSRKWGGMPGDCVVYMLLEDNVGPNDIAYIGCTNNVERRAREHARSKRNFHTLLVVSHKMARRDAMSVEYELMGKHRPPLNSASEYRWLGSQIRERWAGG